MLAAVSRAAETGASIINQLGVSVNCSDEQMRHSRIAAALSTHCPARTACRCFGHSTTVSAGTLPACSPFLAIGLAGPRTHVGGGTRANRRGPLAGHGARAAAGPAAAGARPGPRPRRRGRGRRRRRHILLLAHAIGHRQRQQLGSRKQHGVRCAALAAVVSLVHWGADNWRCKRQQHGVRCVSKWGTRPAAALPTALGAGRVVLLLQVPATVHAFLR